MRPQKKRKPDPERQQLLLQRNVFRCQLLQRRQFAVVKLVDSLCFFVCFDFCAMLLIEFC